MTVSTQSIKVYDEIIEFIAAGTTPQTVVEFQLSETARERLTEIIYRHKTTQLMESEKSELDKFLVLEHIIRLAKARARKYLSAE